MSNWIEQIVQQHGEFESPLSFWRWAAIASISATVKDNIWMDRYIYKLYPNIYVMFHAESGLKKGPPVGMANAMVKAVNNTRIISGRSSIQGILKELGTAYTAPGKPPLMKSVAFICSSELSSSIVDDPVATKILTDLYDRQYRVGEWKSLLKMEAFELKDPTITMLTATNEAMSEDFLTKSAIKGGYVARTFIIYEAKRNRPNALLDEPDIKIDYVKNAEYLKELAKLSGPFEPLGNREKSENYPHAYTNAISGRTTYRSEAGIIYQEWYDNFIQSLDSMEFKDTTGTLNRFGDSVLKVAMLLSLARAPTLKIYPDVMQEAIDVCETLIGNVRQATEGKTGKEDANTVRKAIIMQELMERHNHMISRIQLNKKYWMHGNVGEWDECALSLEATGMLIIESMGNQIIYRMPELEYQRLKEFYQGRDRK